MATTLIQAASARSAHSDLIDAKLVIPSARPWQVRRTRILRQLRKAGDARIIAVWAPAGYGKTSTVAQWAATEPTVAWLTVDDGDNDPVRLFTYLAGALERVIPIDPAVFTAIGSRKVSIRTSVGHILSAISESRERIVVVIDDAQRISDRSCLDALAEFIAYLPAPSQAVVLSRGALDLPYPRWRAQGTLLELGPHELAMDSEEAGRLVDHLGVDLPADALRTLVERTEGWPALLALSAMAAGRAGVTTEGGLDADASIADYLRTEVLERQGKDTVRFLTRTSILERLNGPVCDAVMGDKGSTAMLEALARSTILVDEYGGWYRYHPLLRSFLARELATSEPAAISTLHRRASTWYESTGDLDQAIRHAFDAGDLDRAGAILGGAFIRLHWTARRASLRSWIDLFGPIGLEQQPWLAVLAAFEACSAGDTETAERLADIAERGTYQGRPPDGTSSFESARAMLRVVLARGGADGMLANALRAVELEPEDSRWRDFALWMLAIASLTMGRRDDADRLLADAVAAARRAGNRGLEYCLVGHRALVAIDRNDWPTATALLDDADMAAAARVDGYPSTAPASAARARLAIHRGDVATAKEQLTYGVNLRAAVGGLGSFAVLCLLGLARGHLAVGDAAGARAALTQANGMIRQIPDLGVLPAEVADLRRQIDGLPISIGGASSLTPAELRVLAMLPYYLSFAEIGDRLGIRATTVKTHALSIYGKLGASTRSEAVELAVQAGLLDPFLI